jgi:hypothetical protein
MIKSDRPHHLTSRRRGEGFFVYLHREKSPLPLPFRGWGGYSMKIVDTAIMWDFAIALYQKALDFI